MSRETCVSEKTLLVTYYTLLFVEGVGRFYLIWFYCSGFFSSSLLDRK